MDPNPSTEQCSSMDIDPSTPPDSPHEQTIDRIPLHVVKAAYEDLALYLPVFRNGDDDRIRRVLGLVWTIVHRTLEQDPTLCNHLASEAEFQDNIKNSTVGEKGFINFLKQLAKEEQTDSWKTLLEHDVFFMHRADPVQLRLVDRKESVNATMRAWKREFQGHAAGVLLTTISDYLDTRKNVYARLAPIVNSSGTGKSRMVDDLSKEIITVPMCLREHGSGGFPPPDATLRDWLLADANSKSQDSSAKRLHGLMYSLLCVTLQRLQSIAMDNAIPQNGQERQRALASAFRSLMTDDQSFLSPGKYRTAFYEDVITKANEFVEKSRPVMRIPKKDTPPLATSNVSVGAWVTEAGDELCKFVDPSGVLDLNVGPRRPLIIISFDESHKLADELRGRNWTLFSELRRVLRELVDLRIFALFLSTAGKFRGFSPETSSDPSDRLAASAYKLLHPISEISFDDIVLPSTGGVGLTRVVEMDWISHLGRPLFGTRYDAMPVSIRDGDVMSFAKQKLLNGWNSLRDNSKDLKAGILACLSVRFGLEFNTDEAESRAIACTQVERHMRLCLAATSGFQRLVTISGSEPLLAEAARVLMEESRMNPVLHLANHSDLNCIDRGRRGELIAALIIIQARDEAARAANRKWITVSEFMEALLPAHNELNQSMPILWREGENKTFHETFKNYGMWFNHCIKVENGNMISADHLWKFIKRGAMVVCKNGHYGIDIVLPVCEVNGNLSPGTVTAILLQIKNDKKFKENIQPNLFNAMDPFSVGLFNAGQLPRPVIQVVFALASPTSAICIPPPPTHKNHFDGFTVFRVWCAGLRDTFRHISDDVGSYKALLNRLPKPLDAFDLEEIDDMPLGEEAITERGYQRRMMAALVTS